MEQEQTKVIKCQCGKEEHYVESNYCVVCGKSLKEEKATISDFSKD